MAKGPVHTRMAPGQILTACFGDEDESRRALEACALLDRGEIDAATGRLLPFLYRRWGALTGNRLVEMGHCAYIATWRQNRERMAHLGSVLLEFEKAGIPCMLLKGAALTLRHYRDYGLRGMGDFDLLIHGSDLERAADLLMQTGWTPEEGCPTDAIRRQSRVRHAWQFFGSDKQNCDLHWRPLARCCSPQVTEMFWQGAEPFDLDGHAVRVPCPTDQFFHTCVHAMHWEWTPNLYWMADAITVLRDGQPDWDRAAALATKSGMRIQFAQALAALAAQFHRIVPKQLLGADVPPWQQHEYRLMQKPCPLGMWDSVAWHIYHFQRLRPFDSRWSKTPGWIGFPQYLAAFLNASDWHTFLTKLWLQVKRRARQPRREN